jgi:uncharacterized protein
MERRDFVKLGVTAVLAGRMGRMTRADNNAEIPQRLLGHTHEKVSIVGLGGFHIGQQKDEKESIAIIRSALDRGINFLDNSWDYNGGQSEIRMGKALRDGYRQKAFLMTKIDGRDRATAMKQIDDSLQRLQTDHIDLLQFHECIRLSDPDRIFSENGAVHAAEAARRAGKIRYIGFTGHKNPAVHLKMLRTAASHKFTFAAVQMPLNVMDAHYESFTKQVLPVAQKEKIGILGMKPMGDPFILKSKTVTPIECLHYAMNLPTSVVITGCDSMKILDQAVQAAISFRPMSEEQVAAILSKTSQAAKQGEFELYKTSHHFDSTYEHPEWLGPGTPKETWPNA